MLYMRVFAVAASAFALNAQVALAAPFQDDGQGTCGPNAGQCSFDFRTVPAGKRLEVKNESCFLFSSNSVTLTVQFVVLNSALNPVITETGVPVPIGTNAGGSRIGALNNQTTYFVPAGGRVRAVMTADPVGNLELDCKIAGDIFNFP